MDLNVDFSVIPNKMAFKIGEVAKLLGVKPYVLRYWETEFSALSPKKSKNNQRIYQKKDVERALLIKALLYQERYSIEGARSVLRRVYLRVQSNKELNENHTQTIKRAKEVLKRLHRLRAKLPQI